MRSAATSSSGIVTVLPYGSKLTVLGRSGSWTKVKTGSGLSGYVFSSYISTSSSASTTSTTTSTSSSVSSSASGQAVASYALQFVGRPYVWSGESLYYGSDCSGFTKSVYAHFGYSLPHYDLYQRYYGTPVASLSQAQPGDLIFYSGHVAIYIGGGKIVHAANRRDGVKISYANYRSIACIRRILR